MTEAKNINLNVKNGENLETKLLIIRKMMFYKIPVSMYKVAKDLKMSSSHVYYHFQSLIESGVVLFDGKQYRINECFKCINDFLELLMPFFEAIIKTNPEFSEEQLTDIASYMLAITTIEVDENE